MEGQQLSIEWMNEHTEKVSESIIEGDKIYTRLPGNFLNYSFIDINLVKREIYQWRSLASLGRYVIERAISLDVCKSKYHREKYRI